MHKVFIGYDKRQPLAFTVAAHSVVSNASRPVSVTPLILDQLPIERRGLTDFTFSRYLVPWLCGYDGHALFIDPDVVVLDDVVQLIESCADNPGRTVYVNQHQARFEWPSVMVFDCSLCHQLTPKYIDNPNTAPQNIEQWADMGIGSFDAEWNVCVGYAEGDHNTAKLLHYTEGIPCWPETMGNPEDHHWHTAKLEALHTVPWVELMGGSVHAAKTLSRFLKQRGVTIK